MPPPGGRKESMLTDHAALMDLYEVCDQRHLEDIGSDAYVLRHKKTGARLIVMPNDDENKVFYIGFRTPPTDSTGVAHIIEHTVLCGSRDFPVKDPFIILAKGSLNTFLNAMTYPDKTVYPVASCNDRDFKNLMHVYLDAVFYPRIYQEENIFRQEGWHYEIDPDTGELKINGVVYNEMKGALSSADDVLGRMINAALYPDTPYAVESGGDPDYIPDLTYEAYLDFHRRYYHPSNSYIYLYGSADMVERLLYLDEAYLSRFEALHVDSALPLQKTFEKPGEVKAVYSVMQDEETKGRDYLAANFCLTEKSLTGEEILALKILDYCLCDAEGAPVRRALRDKGIGQEVFSVLELGIRQPSWSVISKNTEASRREEFLSTIEETLRGLVRDGFDHDALLAGINSFAFRYKEANFGSTPRGLIYGLGILDSWLYDAPDPFRDYEISGLFGKLRDQIGRGYFEDLISRYLLNNPHRAVIVLEPEPGLADRKAAALRDRLASYYASLTEEERQKIAEDEKALRAWQETPDTEEALATIPALSREDLKREAVPYINDMRRAGDVPFLTHPLSANGIHYLTFLFDITDMPARYLSLLGIFRTAFAAMDTEHYSYAKINNEINIYTGGISCSVTPFTSARTHTYRLKLEIRVRTLHENLADAFRILEELLLHTDFSDPARLLEILEEERSAMREELSSAGSATAAIRALSYISETALISDQISGVEGYRTLDRTVRDLTDPEKGKEASAALSADLAAMAAFMFRKDNLIADDTALEEDLPAAAERIEDLSGRLHGKPSVEPEPFRPVLKVRNEGFRIPGMVQYVCRAGTFAGHGLPYTGALKVLRIIFAYDFLWSRIRVKGGAYGCSSSFSTEGYCYLVSFRDPHLKKTLKVYEEAAGYVESFEADEDNMTRFVIGTVSAMDHPMTPPGRGRYSMVGYLTDYDMERVQRERDQVLTCTAEDIRALAPYIRAFMEDSVLCVVGSDEKIRAGRDLFLETSSLV